MKRIAAVLFGVFLAGGWMSAGFADEPQVDPRESAVDRALGGMVEGSRMPSPEGSFTERGRQVPGRGISPTTDMRSTVPAGAGAGPQAPVSQSPMEGGARGGLFEPAAPSGPADVGIGGGEVGSGGSDLGGSAGGGDLGGGAGGVVEPGLGGGTEEPVAGPSEGSIIDIDAGVNVGGGEVDANLDVGVDTEAGSLLELDAASDIAAEAPIAVEVDSAESAVIESDLGIEEGINEAPASGEVEAGIEANVDASGESDEPVDNPADGLSL